MRNKSIEAAAMNYQHFWIGDKISKDETIILQSFFNVINKEEQNKHEAIGYYLNELQNLNTDETTKINCKNFFTFYNDLMIYTEGLKTKTESSCFDDCMKKKGAEAANSHWCAR